MKLARNFKFMRSPQIEREPLWAVKHITSDGKTVTTYERPMTEARRARFLRIQREQNERDAGN